MISKAKSVNLESETTLSKIKKLDNDLDGETPVVLPVSSTERLGMNKYWTPVAPSERDSKFRQ